MNKIEFSKNLSRKYLRNSPIKWQKEGFAMLPTAILLDDRLSRACLMVFWVLTMHIFKGKAYCFPSQALIAREARCKRRTVIRALNQLKEFGYLEVDSGKEEGKANKYYLKSVI